jgi:hypothetical protein
MHHALPSRRVIVAQLDATIAKAERRVRWRRFVLEVLATLGRDTPGAKAVLRRAELRLASLRDDRRYLLRVREAPPW